MGRSSCAQGADRCPFDALAYTRRLAVLYGPVRWFPARNSEEPKNYHTIVIEPEYLLKKKDQTVDDYRLILSNGEEGSKVSTTNFSKRNEGCSPFHPKQFTWPGVGSKFGYRRWSIFGCRFDFPCWDGGHQGIVLYRLRLVFVVRSFLV